MMKREVFFTVVFSLSIFFMILPSIILLIIIKASLYELNQRSITNTNQQSIFVHLLHFNHSKHQTPLTVNDPPEACEVNEMGWNFNMVFMENDNFSRGEGYYLDIYPIPRYQEDVRVLVNWSSSTTPKNYSHVEIVMMPNEHKVIEIPNSLQLNKSEQSMKGVTIKASDKIGVYGLSRHEATCDGFLVLPNHLLGRSHYVVCFFPQDRKNQIAFVAIQDNTTVTLTLRNHTRPGIKIIWKGVASWNGNNVTFNLVRREAVQIQADGELTGCGVHSDNPIAVFAGNDLTRVANNLAYNVDVNYTWVGNHLVEQIPEVGHWGTTFYLAPFIFKFNSTDSSPGYLIKMVCSQGDTLIYVYFASGNRQSFVCTLHGDYHKMFVQNYEGLSIYSNNSILVAQIFASSTELSPSMVLITPTEKFNNYYVFPTPKSDSNSSFFHFLQIKVSDKYAHGVLLDKKHLPLSISWKSYNDMSDYVWTSFEILEGVHTLSHENNRQFGATIVGHSKTRRYCSYAYPAGLCS